MNFVYPLIFPVLSFNMNIFLFLFLLINYINKESQALILTMASINYEFHHYSLYYIVICSVDHRMCFYSTVVVLTTDIDT